jgi:hypothetical protein
VNNDLIYVSVMPGGQSVVSQSQAARAFYLYKIPSNVLFCIHVLDILLFIT